MKHFAFASLFLVLSGCVAHQGKLVWRVRDMAFVQTPTIGLQGRGENIVLTIDTPTVQKLLLAHIRISRAANVQAELVIVEGNEANAFVGLMNGRRVIAINTAMIKFIGENIDEYAALLGHETAHWAKGHVESGKTRSDMLQGIGTLAAMGLGAVGVPAAGLITGLGADLIDASYSRDQEREADALGVEYMRAAGFDPQGAVRLYEKLLKMSNRAALPFLSSHPSGEERIRNLKALVESRPLNPTP